MASKLTLLVAIFLAATLFVMTCNVCARELSSTEGVSINHEHGYERGRGNYGAGGYGGGRGYGHEGGRGYGHEGGRGYGHEGGRGYGHEGGRYGHGGHYGGGRGHPAENEAGN